MVFGQMEIVSFLIPRIDKVFWLEDVLLYLLQKKKVWSWSNNVYGWSNVSRGKSISFDKVRIEVATVKIGVNVAVWGIYEAHVIIY